LPPIPELAFAKMLIDEDSRCVLADAAQGHEFAGPVLASDPWGTAPRGGVPPQVLEMRREELHLGPLALEAA